MDKIRNEDNKRNYEGNGNVEEDISEKTAIVQLCGEHHIMSRDNMARDARNNPTVDRHEARDIFMKMFTSGCIVGLMKQETSFIIIL